MDYRYKHQFPSYLESFPLVSQSQLIADAFQEAKVITQAPDPMVYLTTISAVSTALQGLINVELPTGKICPVSLATLTIAESGERKTTVENLLMNGIKKFEREAIKTHKENLKRYKLALEFHESVKTRIKKKGQVKLC